MSRKLENREVENGIVHTITLEELYRGTNVSNV